jgi:outer membrane lipoprotein SlyB
LLTCWETPSQILKTAIVTKSKPEFLPLSSASYPDCRCITKGLHSHLAFLKDSTMRLLTLSILATAFATGCATTQQAPAKPLLYPNATFNKLGQAAAEAQVDACLAKAQAAGLTPMAQNNAVAQGAAAGGLMAGVAGTVGGLVSGRGLDGALKQGVASAAVGGATGAAGGSLHPTQPNPLYRNFVQRCIAEHGLESIGWN